MFRLLNTMSTKLLSNSPLRLAQESVGQLPCLSSAVRNLNSILKSSSDAKYQSTHQEGDGNPSSSPSKQGLQCPQENVITSNTLSANDLHASREHTTSSALIERSKSSMMDKNNQCNSPKEDNKENDMHNSDNNFMLAMLSDTLALTSKALKSGSNGNVASSRPLKELNSDYTVPSHHPVSNIPAKKQSIDESKDAAADASVNCSSHATIPQTISGVHHPRPFTVSIEGNIGSGKSTFLKHFATIPDVATYQEPLWKWTDVGGHNLLGKMYEDTKRWGFLFQSYVQLTRLHIHLNNEQLAKVKLIERSLHNNRYCFVESGHDAGDLQDSEYDVLCEYFEFLEENLNLGVDLIVYLRSTPEVVHRRMQQRGRAEEAGVPLAYLQRIHDYYERWLIEGVPHQPPAPVLVIDADSDLTTVIRSYNTQKPVILGQIPFQPERRGEKRTAENALQGKENKCNDEDKTS